MPTTSDYARKGLAPLMQKFNRRNAGVGFLAAACSALALAAFPHFEHAASAQPALHFSPATINYDGHHAQVYKIVQGGTAYMPVYYVMQALNEFGCTNQWNGSSWLFSVSNSQAIDWNNLSIGTGKVALYLNQRLVSMVDPIVAIDPNSGKPTTYMPVWYVMQMLQRAGIACSWNGSQWSLANQPNLPQPAQAGLWNSAFINGDATSVSDLQMYRHHVNVLFVNAFDLHTNGTLTQDEGQVACSYAHQNGMLAIARIDSFDGSSLANLLANPQNALALAQRIVQAVVAGGYDGVNIDFEFLPAAAQVSFLSFLQQLHVLLANQDKWLTIDVPAIDDPASDTWDRAYNLQQIGEIADKEVLMSYDYSYPGSPPGPIAPLPWVVNTISYTVSQTPSAKVLLGIDTYAYDWGNSDNPSVLTLQQVDNLASQPGTTVSYNASTATPRLTYSQNGITHTVYYETPASLASRIAEVGAFALGGIAQWRIGLEDPATDQVLDSLVPAETGGTTAPPVANATTTAVTNNTTS
ncbi:Peptidoglycan-binding domain 1 protein [Alicyclobacillus hesperidum URH17-3-68]|nr:Peptidoglycan-binding domain 1 protein [Alicyclobacillus hesperidum URH17-3-68]